MNVIKLLQRKYATDYILIVLFLIILASPIVFMLIVKAIKDIKKGEELCVSYIEPKPMALRKNELLKWDFTCDCKYCKQEAEICDKDEYFNIFETYIKIQNIMVTHGITSFESLENNFTVYRLYYRRQQTQIQVSYPLHTIQVNVVLRLSRLS